MLPIARVTDKHVCPVHGTNMIVTGQSMGRSNQNAIACVGDKTACGAVIINGSSISAINGKPVAYLGSKTSHGGVIVTGDSNALVQP